MWLCGLELIIRRQKGKGRQSLTTNASSSGRAPEWQDPSTALSWDPAALLAVLEHLPYPVSLLIQDTGEVVLQNKPSVLVWGNIVGGSALFFERLFRLSDDDTMELALRRLCNSGTWKGLVRVQPHGGIRTSPREATAVIRAGATAALEDAGATPEAARPRGHPPSPALPVLDPRTAIRSIDAITAGDALQPLSAVDPVDRTVADPDRLARTPEPAVHLHANQRTTASLVVAAPLESHPASAAAAPPVGRPPSGGGNDTSCQRAPAALSTEVAGALIALESAAPQTQTQAVGPAPAQLGGPVIGSRLWMSSSGSPAPGPSIHGVGYKDPQQQQQEYLQQHHHHHHHHQARPVIEVPVCPADLYRSDGDAGSLTPGGGFGAPGSIASGAVGSPAVAGSPRGAAHLGVSLARRLSRRSSLPSGASSPVCAASKDSSNAALLLQDGSVRGAALEAASAFEGGSSGARTPVLEAPDSASQGLRASFTAGGLPATTAMGSSPKSEQQAALLHGLSTSAWATMLAGPRDRWLPRRTNSVHMLMRPTQPAPVAPGPASSFLAAGMSPEHQRQQQSQQSQQVQSMASGTRDCEACGAGRKDPEQGVPRGWHLASEADVRLPADDGSCRPPRPGPVSATIAGGAAVVSELAGRGMSAGRISCSLSPRRFKSIDAPQCDAWQQHAGARPGPSVEGSSLLGAGCDLGSAGRVLAKQGSANDVAAAADGSIHSSLTAQPSTPSITAGGAMARILNITLATVGPKGGRPIPIPVQPRAASASPRSTFSMLNGAPSDSSLGGSSAWQAPNGTDSKLLLLRPDSTFDSATAGAEEHEAAAQAAGTLPPILAPHPPPLQAPRPSHPPADDVDDVSFDSASGTGAAVVDSEAALLVTARNVGLCEEPQGTASAAVADLVGDLGTVASVAAAAAAASAAATGMAVDASAGSMVAWQVRCFKAFGASACNGSANSATTLTTLTTTTAHNNNNNGGGGGSGAHGAEAAAAAGAYNATLLASLDLRPPNGCGRGSEGSETAMLRRRAFDGECASVVPSGTDLDGGTSFLASGEVTVAQSSLARSACFSGVQLPPSASLSPLPSACGVPAPPSPFTTERAAARAGVVTVAFGRTDPTAGPHTAAAAASVAADCDHDTPPTVADADGAAGPPVRGLAAVMSLHGRRPVPVDSAAAAAAVAKSAPTDLSLTLTFGEGAQQRAVASFSPHCPSHSHSGARPQQRQRWQHQGAPGGGADAAPAAATAGRSQEEGHTRQQQQPGLSGEGDGGLGSERGAAGFGSVSRQRQPAEVMALEVGGDSGGRAPLAHVAALAAAPEPAKPSPDARPFGATAGAAAGRVAPAAAAAAAPLSQAHSATEGSDGEAQWHEVSLTSFMHPQLRRRVVLVVQNDVSERIWAERQLVRVVEAEHTLLENIFPHHVLEHIATTAAKARAKGGGGGGSGGSESGTPDLAVMTARLSATTSAALQIDTAVGCGGGGGPAGPAGDRLPAIRGSTFLHLATSHRAITVLFCDIQGFTPLCNEVRPVVVMSFLNDLFTRLDSLLDTFGVYKVETIGDCYVAAGGLMKVDEETGAVTVRSDDVDPQHAHRTVQFAKALLRAAAAVRLPTSGEPVQLRVGIHSGPAMSGVVGTRMPRFCLFGDTMNTASRMESTGVAGAVHVSEATRALVPGEDWEPTGGVQVKGKGTMNTFLLRPQLW